MVFLVFIAIPFPVAGILAWLLASSRARVAALRGAGAVLAIGVFVVSYLGSPSGGPSEGCSDCGLYWGRWWEPWLVAEFILFGLIAWQLGSGRRARRRRSCQIVLNCSNGCRQVAQ
jgi:hypothetical protein